jgi:type I restriction enzyme S subunit
MNWPTYRDYSASTFGWLGDLRAGWTATPLKRIASVQTGLTLGKAVEPEDAIELPYLRVANVQAGGLDLSEVKTVALDRADALRHQLRPGDVLMTEGGDIDKLGRGCLWNGEIAPCLHQNHVFAVRCSADLSNRFLVYILESPPARDYFYMTAKQTTNLASTNSTTLGNFTLALPPLPVQWKIVDHLDAKCIEVDALIAKQEQLIATLREDRTATITHVVTKGLDPGVEMEDSGIAWIGTFPNHWTHSPIKYACTILTGFPFKSEGFTDDPDDVPLLRGTNVGVDQIDWTDVVYWPRGEASALSEYQLEVDDIVMGLDRPFISAGIRVSRLGADDVPSLLLQRVARIRGVAAFEQKYLFYLLTGPGIVHHLTPIFTGVSVPHVSPDQVVSFPIPQPPIDEQRRIVKYLDMRCSQIDTLIAKANEVVATLRECRSALITDAVTGKIDVRESVA